MTTETDSSATRNIRRVFHGLVLMAIVLCVLQFSFAIFGIPRGLVYWLKCGNVPRSEKPDWIIVLGGSGIPSSTSLMRAYYGAHCARAHPAAQCVVALPAENDGPRNSAQRMRRELAIRGVDPSRIHAETRGMNTHEQAENIARMLGPKGRRSPILIVSSPYHLRRAYLCFKKAGFEHVGLLAAHSVSSEGDYEKAVEAWSGIGNPRSLLGHFRYGFWINLSAEVWITRELIGLAVYKARGWI